MKHSSMKPSDVTRLRRDAPAFSLVEVTIAVAIASLGFISVLGLLPQGINMARNSAQLSVGSKIIQKLHGEIQSTPWSRITWTGYGPPRCFTSEGMELTSTDASEADLAASMAFAAAIYVPETPLDVVLPAGNGGGGGRQAEAFLRRVVISVATTSDPEFDFNTAAPQRLTSANVLVAKMGE